MFLPGRANNKKKRRRSRVTQDLSVLLPPPGGWVLGARPGVAPGFLSLVSLLSLSLSPSLRAGVSGMPRMAQRIWKTRPESGRVGPGTGRGGGGRGAAPGRRAGRGGKEGRKEGGKGRR